MHPTPTDPQAVVAALEKKAEREAVVRGRAFCDQGRVRAVEEQPQGEGVLVRGTVYGTRSVPHRAALRLLPTRLEYECDCGYRRWPCRHVLAVAKTWAGLARRAPTPGEAPADWRRLVETLVPRPPSPVPEPGREILVHWIELHRSAGAGWELALSWRLHKVGAKGIGRGRVVPPLPLRKRPPAVAGSADRDVIDAALDVEAAELSGPGVWVRVGGEAAGRVLAALARAPWVFWAETRQPAVFDARPLCVRVAARAERQGVRLQPEWLFADGTCWRPAAARVLGARPPWVEDGGTLRPVAGPADGAALARLFQGGVRVPEGELPAFLGAAVPRLEAGGIHVALDELADRDLAIGTTAQPVLYLSEEEGTLVATLRFAYGDYEVAADNPDAVLAVGPGERRGVLRRDMEGEFAATQRLRALGFRPVEPGRFESTGDAALEFLSRDFEPLAAQWRVYGRDDLARFRVSATPVSLRVRLGVNIDWLDLSVEGSADGEAVDAQEIWRALRAGSRYVRLGSGAHARLPREWVARLQPALSELAWRKGRARVPRHLAPVVEEVLEGLPQVEYRGRAAWDRLRECLRGGGGAPALPPPEGLEGVLRPYQLEGYRWLRFMGELGFGCVLADDMGLGKTVQALAVLLAEREGGASLAVAPTSVVPNWEAEARRFAPSLRVVRYHGADRRERVGDLTASDLVITSYAVLRRDIEALSQVSWNYVILDEAQAIKNAATQTARCARRLEARRRLALTGTPLENHLGELWSQFHFLMPGLLGSERHFTRRFARPIAQGDEEVRETLGRRIRPFILRRLKAEVARDLPAKTDSVLWCELLPDQEQLYRRILAAGRERVFRDLEEKGLPRARFSVLEALLRLRQVCCHPEILPGDLGRGVASAKFDRFRDFVAEVLDEGHRVLVFSQFVKVLGVLRRWFEQAGISHLYLDGRTRNREEVVRGFQEDASVAAFLVSLKAGGSGLNLTGADYVILYDPWWNPAVEAQAADRAHRIGQTRSVFAYKMITRGTVEEKILLLQERKKDLTDQLIRSAPQWAAGLTEEDIAELLADP
ncbi:MAG: DEAD/DEAH box helicase [Deferrisomatales bacterium]